MGDPELQALGCEADPLMAAETVGQNHRHMAAELTTAAIEHQRQPGVKGIGPQTPEAQLRQFGELAGILRLKGPVEGEIQGAGGGEQISWGACAPGLQRREIQAADAFGGNREAGGRLGHQEL